jgi:excisionase family DNA binding protein
MNTLKSAQPEQRPQQWAFSYQQAAVLSGLSPSTIRRLVKSGKLECVRTGRAVRIPIHAVERLCGLPEASSLRSAMER